MEWLVPVLRYLLSRLFRLKLVNFDQIKLDSRTIIMPNHVSFLDALFLTLYLPTEVVFVVNTEIANKISPVLRYRKHITIDPLNPYSMRQIISAVKEGLPLMIFPEGRITTTRGLMKIYDGIGFIALKSGATIYPIGINGLEHSKLSRLQDKLHTRWFPQVTIYVGEPFVIQANKKLSLKEQNIEATEQILRVMQKTVFRSKYRTNINLFNELLEAGQVHHMGRQICEDISQKLSYRKLLLGIYVLSGKLRTLLPGQQQVGMLLPNSIGHVVTLFSLFRLNVTPAILNFTLGPQSILDCCEAAGLKTVLTSRQFIDKAGLHAVIDKISSLTKVVYLEDVRSTISTPDKLNAFVALLLGIRTTPDKDTLILFTSGSESKPKGVILRHDNILANIHQASCVIDFTSKDKVLNVLPMFHSFGLTAGTFLPLLCGVELFLYPTPLHYKIIPEIAYDRNATILFGTSTFLHGYGEHAHPYDFYSMRYVFAGAEKLKEETRKLWIEKFGIRILEGYGCTETAPILSLNTPLANKPGSVGRFLPDLEYRVDPVEGIACGGNLFVKGPNVMEGYLIHGKGFAPAGEWYDCGDLVEVDEKGFITILSRLKRFAKVGGEMVSLNLVEELAARCFQDLNFAAINVPDGRKGEKIILYTSVKNADRNLLREYISQSGQSLLLLPSRIIHLDHLPLLGSGKLDYVSLKAIYAIDPVGQKDDDSEQDEAIDQVAAHGESHEH